MIGKDPKSIFVDLLSLYFITRNKFQTRSQVEDSYSGFIWTSSS